MSNQCEAGLSLLEQFVSAVTEIAVISMYASYLTTNSATEYYLLG